MVVQPSKPLGGERASRRGGIRVAGPLAVHRGGGCDARSHGSQGEGRAMHGHTEARERGDLAAV
ncbi:hypothetical protein AYR46_20185 [Sphingobium yanoikuyae]|nr:hypothetical protein AYR46_20185 [Sphingobium yanoikuyae]